MISYSFAARNARYFDEIKRLLLRFGSKTRETIKRGNGQCTGTWMKSIEVDNLCKNKIIFVYYLAVEDIFRRNKVGILFERDTFDQKNKDKRKFYVKK